MLGSGDAGGVLVSPAPAEFRELQHLTTAVAVSGRLLEPELIVLSSHGGHHLFINRIPPRLPKEDVEKIILAQLRLHPFVLQVSKCSVIPQNSLKNKGYGFITLDGSPSPSDLGAIADSLNNKLQVGCRTLGVRVCTDCHSACYAEEDGCASSASSTPPNEPADDDEPPVTHVQGPADDAAQSANSSAEVAVVAASSQGGDTTVPAPGQGPMRSSSAPAPQLELLQTAVAALAKQASLPTGQPAPGPSAGPRRRKAGKQHLEPGRYLQQQPHLQPHDHQQQAQERLGCRLVKPQGAGHQRRHTADASPGATASADMVPGSAGVALLPLERRAAEGSRSPAGPSDLVHLPPPPAPVPPVSAQPPVMAQRPRQELQQQQQGQPELQQDGECGVNAALLASPRSVSSYSSASGSGAGSTSNSAPGSVCSGSGTGSGRVSGSSAGGWGSQEDSAEPRALGPPTVLPPVGAKGALAADAVCAAEALAGAPLPNGVSRRPCSSHQQQQEQHHQDPLRRQQQQRPLRSALHGRSTSDGPAATSPLHRPSAVQQPTPSPGLVHQQPFGSAAAARCSRPVSHGSRASSLAAPLPVGSHGPGRAGRGQMGSAQRLPPPPPPPVPQQSSAWSAVRTSTGYGPMGPAHLHSASAPTSSSWYMQHYQQRHYQQGLHRHPQQRHHHLQQQQQRAPGGAFAPAVTGIGGCASGGGVGGGGHAHGGGGGVGGPHLLRQPSQQQAVSDSATGFQPCGAPRLAWADGPSAAAVGNGPGSGVERRGSHSSGPSPGAFGGLPARLQAPVSQYYQQQLPPSQQQLQLQHQQQQQQQSRSASHALSASTNVGAQAQQPVAAVAYQPKHPQQQQQQAQAQPHAQKQQALGRQFAPQLQQQQPGLRHLQQQQQLQQQLGRDGQLPTQQLPQQQQNQQQQYVREPQQQWPQQQSPRPHQHAHQSLFAQSSGGGEAAGRVHPAQQQAPLSSAGLPASSPTQASTVLQLQLLMGAAGPSCDAFRVGSLPAPHASSALHPALMDWRTRNSLDFDYDRLHRGRLDAAEPQLLGPGLVGMPFAAAATSGVSVRSAELFLGRGSSDGIQDPGADPDYADSADLDPLDLEPMILQLLENDDDDDSGASGRQGFGQPVHGQVGPPQQHPHRLQQQQPLYGLPGSYNARELTPVSSGPAVSHVPSSAELHGASGGPKLNPPQQQPRQRQQQQQQLWQQPQRRQAGFETDPGAEFAAEWAVPGARSDGSNCTTITTSTGGAYRISTALSTAMAAPVPAAPAAAPAAGFGDLAALGPPVTAAPAAAGSAPAQGGCPPQQPPGPARERPAGTAAMVPTTAAAAAGARWARAPGATIGGGPSACPGVVGSFPGAGAGAFEAVPSAVGSPGLRGRGGGSGGSRAAGGGGGPVSGNGTGFRGGRYAGSGGRGSGAGGGRIVAGLRMGAVVGGFAGGGGAGGAGLAGGRRDSGGGAGGAVGGFEPQGFGIGLLPNGSLLAVMQRLNA